MSYLDDEVARVKEDRTGQYSHEDIQAADSWQLTWERRWAAQVAEDAANRERAMKQKQDELYERVRSSQRSADANRAALESGELSVPEYLSRSARIKAAADEHERLLHDVSSRQAAITEMRQDPIAHQDAFFGKWTALRGSRPNLDQWIAESRESRSRRR